MATWIWVVGLDSGRHGTLAIDFKAKTSGVCWQVGCKVVRERGIRNES